MTLSHDFSVPHAGIFGAVPQSARSATQRSGPQPDAPVPTNPNADAAGEPVHQTVEDYAIDGARVEEWYPAQSHPLASRDDSPPTTPALRPEDLHPNATSEPRRIDTFRPWQLEAFAACKDQQYIVMQAPGGSGKSPAQVMLAQYDIEHNGRKQLIAVPQNHIHHSFFAHGNLVFTLPGASEPSLWVVEYNFCECAGAVERLKTFLLTDPSALDNLAAITTHACLVAVWKRLAKAEKQQALKNTAFRIDEAHHISNVFQEDELALYNVKEREAIIEDATRLGAFIRFALTTDEPTCKLQLATATFFRGDRKTIISKAVKDRFHHFELPWDEYYETLGIKQLEFDFVTYDGDPIAQVVAAVADEPDEKHLIIIPALTTRYRTEDTLQGLLTGLSRAVPQNRILDLVTPETQDRHKKVLFTAPDAFGVVVACRLFDEGTDWVPCTRLHNTDAGERSLTLAVQRFFRPLRQHPTKKHVRIANYIPAFTPEMELEEQRRVLSDRFNAVLASIIMQGELMPVFIPLKSQVAEGKPPRTTLQDLYGAEYRPAIEDLLKEYELVENKQDAHAIEAVVDAVLERHGIPDACDAQNVRAAWLGQLHRITTRKTKASNRESLETRAFDASEIRERGFDEIWSKQHRGDALVWGAENVTSDTIRQLLRVVEAVPTLEEIRTALKAYYERTGSRIIVPGERGGSTPGWFHELNRSISSADHICHRYYKTTLGEQMDICLGTNDEALLDTVHRVIRDCDQDGKRVSAFGENAVIPKIGLTMRALDTRLQKSHGTTLAKEKEKVLGVSRKLPEDYFERIIEVIRTYRDRGVFLHHGYGEIPELNTTSHSVQEWLRTHRNTRIKDIAKTIWEESEGPLLFGPEAVKQLDVPVETFGYWGRKGWIARISIGSSEYLYRQKDIDELKAANVRFNGIRRGPHSAKARRNVSGCSSVPGQSLPMSEGPVDSPDDDWKKCNEHTT